MRTSEACRAPPRAQSASTANRPVTNPARQLHTAVERYLDNLTVAPTIADAQSAGPAPLPWLPPLPACRDDTWRTYLSARAEQSAELADEIARRSTANSSPGSIVNRRDPTLLGHLDVWEAVHAGDAEDDDLSGREQLYERHLYERRQAISTCPYASPRRWLPLVTAIDPAAAEAPEYPRLAAALTDAFDVRIDVDRLLPRLLADHRDDYAAAVDDLRARADKAESQLREALHGRELEHARARQLHSPYRTPAVDPPGHGISR